MIDESFLVFEQVRNYSTEEVCICGRRRKLVGRKSTTDYRDPDCIVDGYWVYNKPIRTSFALAMKHRHKWRGITK
jgi:hypothetical protein